MNQSSLRIAAVSDLHFNKQAHGKFNEMFERISTEADVFCICGDLTDYGLPEEAALLTADLRAHVRIPIIGVLGNHDYESGRHAEVVHVMEEAGVTMLDGSCTEIDGVGFAGISGFGGGFGDRMLTGWGERTIKDFVQAAVDEELKLEQALARLQVSTRVALLHYSPIRGTVEGEPLEIYPFLGSSRLEEPLNRFHVTAAMHGHAHHGTPEGKTSTGVPVYNVSIPVLKQSFPDTPPYRIIEVSREDEKDEKGPSD